MSDKPKPKPCHFCLYDEPEVSVGGFAHYPKFQVKCPRCGYCGPFGASYEMAVGEHNGLQDEGRE